jgi:uncharacterized protein YggE
LLQERPIERNRVYAQTFSGIAANVRASAQPGVLQNSIRLTRAAEACRLRTYRPIGWTPMRRERGTQLSVLRKEGSQLALESNGVGETMRSSFGCRSAGLVLAVFGLLGGEAIVRSAEVELRGAPADLQKYLQPARRTVTLTGHAKQTVPSDVGHVSVIVRTQAKELAAAMRANAERRTALAQQLTREGIPDKAIRAEKFSSSPQFGWFGRTPTSYEVVNRLIVDVTDDAQLIRVSEVAAHSTDTSIGAIAFEYTQRTALQETVRHLAFDDAIARKAFYEERLGAMLRPVAFAFSDRTARAERPAEGIEEIVVTGSKRSDSFASAPTPPPSFDEQQYEVSVEVTFDVEPRPGKN